MHGWPESWFSWRHQLKACKAAGYRGIAPDMRGYGGTDSPDDASSYICYTLASDMLALLQHIGAPTAALVGHDHGAATGWTLSLLHPDVFTIYCAMSVPYSPRRPDGPSPIEGMRANFGDERDPASDPGYFYILHHQMPEASVQYGANSRQVLNMLYGDSKAAGATPPEIRTDRMFVDGVAKGMWERGPSPGALSDWISPEELDYVVGEFDSAGWNGGLNWYRVMDVNWHATPQLAGAKLTQPTQFIAGTADSVITMSGGIDTIKKALGAFCLAGEPPVFVEGAGHWIQQEEPEAVNETLLAFANKHRALFSNQSKI